MRGADPASIRHEPKANLVKAVLTAEFGAARIFVIDQRNEAIRVIINTSGKLSLN